MFAGLLLLTLAVAPPPGSLCSVRAMRDDGTPGESISGPTSTAEELVRETPVIVRATAVRQVSVRGAQMSGMMFRVVEVLKGEEVPDSLVFAGYVHDADDYNPGPVPYVHRRNGNVGGSCYAYSYKPGAEYLLFLGRFRWGLTPYHSIFSPTNEQLRGPDDPWLKWVRDRLPRMPLRAPPPPKLPDIIRWSGERRPGRRFRFATAWQSAAGDARWACFRPATASRARPRTPDPSCRQADSGDAMKRTWTIIGVRDVPRSFKWYQSLFGQPETEPAHDHFGQITDTDGTVLLCLHQWGAHEHPSLTSPDRAAPGNGLLLFFRVDDFDLALERARALAPRFEEEPHVNPNTRTREFSLRDADGYYVTLSELPAAPARETA